jgi:hypothetical protein
VEPRSLVSWASRKIAVALGGLPDSIPVHEQPTPAWPATG